MKIILLVVVLLVTSCSSLANDKKGYTLIKEFSLGPDLAETSGLYCPDNDFIYTINDSGNSPIIYKLNVLGEIVEKLEVDKKNRDWESISGDNENFYVGDIGNNNGKRKFVEILVIDKQSVPKKIINSLKITYLNNSIKKNEYLNHDFDAEALVSVENDLFMFSKSWQTNQLHVYKVSKTQSKQDIIPIASIDGLPGLVTGIDYDKKANRYVVVGYSLHGLGTFSPYIALLNSQFKMTESYPLEGFNQVEGVCVTKTGAVWISQESSFFSSQKLAKLKLH